MKEMLKRGMLLGVGAVFLTKDAVQKRAAVFLDEARKTGVDLTPDDAKEFLSNVVKETRKQRVKLERQSKTEAKKMIRKLGYVSAREAKSLQKKVKILEKRLRAAKTRFAR